MTSARQRNLTELLLISFPQIALPSSSRDPAHPHLSAQCKYTSAKNTSGKADRQQQFQDSLAGAEAAKQEAVTALPENQQQVQDSW